MPTRLDAQFLRAIVLVTAMKQHEQRRVEAALLTFAVNGLDFTAADLPKEITNGNTKIAGTASGSLVAMGFIWSVGRVKSPDPKAKGRKLNVFRLCNGRLAAVRAWFREQGLNPPVTNVGGQMELVAV